MKIFLDTANIDEIKKAKKLVQIDGITTNPTIISREHFDENTSSNKSEYAINRIIQEIHSNVNVEIMSTTIDNAIKEIGIIISTLCAFNGLKRINMNNILTFKVPTTSDGLQIMNFLNATGYKVNATLVFTPLQALLASKAGANYVSIFVGRLDDKYGICVGMLVVEETLKIFKQYNIKTEVIVASIRNLEHIRQSAILGAHIITVPPKLIDEMIYHPLTEAGVEQFMSDWRKVNE